MIFKFFDIVRNDLLIDLEVLTKDTNLYTSMLLQHEGIFNVTENKFGNLDDQADLFPKFLCVAKEQQVSLAVTPEYSCPWLVIHSIMSYIEKWPSMRKLWALGCASITPQELLALKEKCASSNVILYFDESALEKGGGLLLDPLCYVFNVTIINRLAKAIGLLANILERDAEMKVLQDFLNENESDIQGIFQSIHSQKEFIKIIFDYKENNVKLKGNGENEPVSLNKISAGQRSALALSFFLALNKKLNKGPNLILMDDPITYVGDLNVLSFLDYLREMLINDRQIFFATANKKLAGLCEKKFFFLGSDFETWILND